MGRPLEGRPASEGRPLHLLGLARRGGRAVVGTRAVQEAARQGELAVALIARDAAENARARVVRALAAGGVRVEECGTRASLGRSVGRGPVVIVGVRDPELGRRILDALKGRKEVGSGRVPIRGNGSGGSRQPGGGATHGR